MTMLHHVVPCCGAMVHNVVPYCTLLYNVVPCCTLCYAIVLCHAVLLFCQNIYQELPRPIYLGGNLPITIALGGEAVASLWGDIRPFPYDPAATGCS